MCNKEIYSTIIRIIKEGEPEDLNVFYDELSEEEKAAYNINMSYPVIGISGDNPLQVACAKYSEDETQLNSAKFIEVLLKIGADPKETSLSYKEPPIEMVPALFLEKSNNKVPSPIIKPSEKQSFWSSLFGGVTRMVFIFLLFSVLIINGANASEDEGCSKVYSSLVFNEDTGNILFETRSDEIVYPASLVKVMTLYLAFEALENHKLSLNEVLIASERGEEVGAVNKNNTLRLKAGDKITVKEAIEAVIVKSFNEAAVTLAEAVSGSEWEFTRLMNKKAKELGMNDSSFRNASGLHEEGQYTTSYDLARLVRAIKINFPQYYHLFALKRFTYNGKKFETHNHVLLSYKGAEGMKTGFTNASGFNLISAAKKDKARIVSVLLGCSTYQKRDQYTKKLLDEAFEKISKKHHEGLHSKITKGFDYDKSSNKEEADEYVRYGMSLE